MSWCKKITSREKLFSVRRTDLVVGYHFVVVKSELGVHWSCCTRNGTGTPGNRSQQITSVRTIPPFKKFKRFSFHHGHQLLENNSDKEHKWIYLHRIPRPLGQNKPQTSHKILNYPFLFKPKKKNYLKPKVINSEIPGRDQDVKR